MAVLLEPTARFANNDFFEGKFKNDVRCGHGVLTYGSSGNVYDGLWLDDAMHGEVRRSVRLAAEREAAVPLVGRAVPIIVSVVYGRVCVSLCLPWCVCVCSERE